MKGTIFLIGVGAALAGIGVWLLSRKPPPPEGIRIDEIVLHDPSGERRITLGGEIRTTVTLTNVGEESIAPRLRVSIKDGRTWIEGEWFRTEVIEPRASATLDVWRDVPANWAAGWAVTVRLDIEGIPDDPENRQWDSYFDIIPPTDFEVPREVASYW